MFRSRWIRWLARTNVRLSLRNRKWLLGWTIAGLAVTSHQVFAQFTYRPFAFTTLAGESGYGSADGTKASARFWNPWGVAVDGAGNIFVADTSHNGIWRMTPTCELTTLAGMVGFSGSTDGTGAAVRFKSPAGIALDGQGNLYVADMGNNTIRKGFPDTIAMVVVISEPTYSSTDGSFEFTLTGPTGQWGVVEASTDLINWVQIWSRVLGGALKFSDSQAGTYAQRFYRARMP